MSNYFQGGSYVFSKHAIFSKSHFVSKGHINFNACHIPLLRVHIHFTTFNPFNVLYLFQCWSCPIHFSTDHVDFSNCHIWSVSYNYKTFHIYFNTFHTNYRVCYSPFNSFHINFKEYSFQYTFYSLGHFIFVWTWFILISRCCLLISMWIILDLKSVTFILVCDVNFNMGHTNFNTRHICYSRYIAHLKVCHTLFTVYNINFKIQYIYFNLCNSFNLRYY